MPKENCSKCGVPRTGKGTGACPNCGNVEKAKKSSTDVPVK